LAGAVFADVGVLWETSDSAEGVAGVITKLEVILVVPVVVVAMVVSVVVVSIETVDDTLEVEVLDFDFDLGLENPSASTSPVVGVMVVVVVAVEEEVEESLIQTLIPECASPSPTWQVSSSVPSIPRTKSTLRA
jgi:hypothetical protein